MKRIIITLVLLSFLWSSVANAKSIFKTVEDQNSFLGNKIKSSVILLVGSPFAYANNTGTFIDADNIDVVPIVKGGRTLVPVRFVMESLGADVSWDSEAHIATMVADGKAVRLQPENKTMFIEETRNELDVPPEIINSRLFLPLRRLSEDVLDKKVFYNDGLIIVSDYEEVLTAENDKDIIDIIISILSSREFNDDKPDLVEAIYRNLLKEGKEFIEERKEEEAAARFEKAAKMLPEERGYIYNNLGDALFEVGSSEMALHYYDMAYDELYIGIQAYIEKGDILYWDKKYNEAAAFFGRALELNPQNIEYIYYSKGAALHYAQKYEEAIECYDNAVEINPEYIDAYKNKVDSLNKLGEFEEAEQVLDRILEIDPDFNTYIARGNICYYKGEYEEAVSYYDKSIELYPENETAYENKVKALEKLDN